MRRRRATGPAPVEGDCGDANAGRFPRRRRRSKAVRSWGSRGDSAGERATRPGERTGVPAHRRPTASSREAGGRRV